MRVHTILHPTDFSKSSTQAFHYACALARDCDARLVVLHSVEPAVAVIGEGMAVPEEIEEMRTLALQHLSELQPPDPEIHLDRILREGPATNVILDTADEFQADLIVMGTHGWTGLKRLLMGSVAELVLRRAKCPVLTVKESAHSPEEKERLASAAH
jgi:nucleotide-binding universal stress UspA family protein